MTTPGAAPYDVIVVGYGYAGAFAAIAAADSGARVLLLEKAAQPGGISICSAGGLRTAEDAGKAFAYLQATCGGKTPDPVLRQLAEGMAGVAARLSALAQGTGARVENRHSPANYPFPGGGTFGFAYVESIEGFDPAAAWPHVRGAEQGALLFRLLQMNVEKRGARIDVRLESPVARLLMREGAVGGVTLADGTTFAARGGVVLACGGFEADPAMQAQYWPGGPALSAAYAGNTGDGIRMAQAAGADLWHMWHWHGCYGYRLPDRDYPFGVRVKRLPDWTPDADCKAPGGLPVMPWILLDRSGRRFMNEYEPYVQDTGGRALATFDPARQRHDRNPAWMVTDAAGLAMYPLGKPTRNDAAARYDWSVDNSSEVESGLFRSAADCAALAEIIGADPAIVGESLRGWNAACAGGADARFGRPASSLHALKAPYFVAPVEPVVSNTQGGPVHDAQQRVLTPGGDAIPGLFAAGECGSAFGHLYMSGGNLAECCVGGGIAGTNAAMRGDVHDLAG
ncbi:FAD-dependent oxidoreductase [Nitratireductor pacificus]|uniref:Fumarate reductase/succinate dehyfrogenase, flavoprotein subunit n=1 Tax=Nitratireductor pacificus pht-3B TaxID=391937 RepID=K2M9N6_9HYPH|nr:FAD-dependent oxidoreductase [Nitratireductor pacificus]EKF18851.1 fumarate reductase/succinate dehyfrogenase, flavoprotein subunit [Nitratireductor pacificus pht-3B]